MTQNEDLGEVLLDTPISIGYKPDVKTPTGTLVIVGFKDYAIATYKDNFNLLDMEVKYGKQDLINAAEATGKKLLEVLLDDFAESYLEEVQKLYHKRSPAPNNPSQLH
jgi:hypothetical protein